MPDSLYGPFGALVFLGIAVGVLAKVIQALWKDHLRSDIEDRDERDRLLVVVEGIVPTLRDISASLKAITIDAADRHRRDDPE